LKRGQRDTSQKFLDTLRYAWFLPDTVALPKGLPAWVPALHAQIKAELGRYH